LNMRNGVNLELYAFNATNNPNLTCIETLDPAHATTNLAYIDAGVTFAVICGGTDLTTWHVDTTGSDASGSGTETSPLATIQTGINAASSGDTVSVAAGTYEEQVQFNSKNISLIGQDSSNTIIKWNGGIAVSLENGLTSHTPHIKNFTIKDGYSDTAGGILISNYGSPVLENLRIVNNTVIYNPDGNNDAGIGDGGGINIYNSSPTILNSYIAYNTAEKMGGGINVQNSTVTIKNTIIANNTANQGGGIYARQTPVYFSGTVSLLNNHASTEGGGISFDGAAPNQLLTNLVVAGNTAGNRGAGIVIHNSSFSIKNSTIVNNKANGNAGGLFVSHGTVLDVDNSIFWNNSPQQIWVDDNTGNNSNTLSFSYSDVQGGESGIPTNGKGTITWGTGNIDKSPLFVDSVAHNFNLKNWSHLIGAGRDGNDIGAFENQYDSPQNAPPVLTALSDVSVNEDELITITLEAINADSADNDAITYSSVSDTNAVTVSVLSATLTLTPNANWHGVANIKAYASDGTSKDSTTFKLTVTPVNDIAAVDDITIDEDKSTEVTLTTTFNGTSTFTAVSDSNSVTTSITSSTLTLTPNANWNGEAQITAYTSMDDGSAKDSTSFKLTVTPVQDAPTAFDWVSSTLDTINITQSNLADTYTLRWGASTDAADGDSINYLIYAKIGLYPTEEVEEITDTTFQLIYEEILENVFEGRPVNGATVSLNVKATDGVDTVDVTGDNRVIYVNRYEYLSTEGEGVPVEFALHENYPNPFNPTTTLRFDLPEVSNLTLTIYNMLGQKVRTFNYQNTSAGYHSVTWDATNDYGDPVGAGVYLYQLQTKDFVKTRKMVLLK
jgi:hypothetical protein